MRMNDLWDIERIGNALGISDGAVRMRIKRGNLPQADFLIAGKKYWSNKTVMDWLERHRGEAKNE